MEDQENAPPPGQGQGQGAAGPAACACPKCPAGPAADGVAGLRLGAPTRRPDPFDPRRRETYLSWDDYFMGVAFLSAQRSKDPNKQVGACIVSEDNVILGIGYNGFPRGCDDRRLPWSKESRTGNALETKYPYVCHAEMNAIMNKNAASIKGQKMYVTMFPCNECAKLMIQSGITEVVYYEDKNVAGAAAAGAGAATTPTKGGLRPNPAYEASRILLDMAGVVLRQHKPKRRVTVTFGGE